MSCTQNVSLCSPAGRVEQDAPSASGADFSTLGATPASCAVYGVRGCPGPRGPQGPQPPLSDAVNSTATDTAASSLAVKTLHDALEDALRRIQVMEDHTVRLLARDTAVYVRTTGNDAADGFSEATAKATLKGAFALLHRLNPGSCRVAVDLGEGEFASADPPGGLYHKWNYWLRGKGVERTVVHSRHAQDRWNIHGKDINLTELTVAGELGVYGGKVGYDHFGDTAPSIYAQEQRVFRIRRDTPGVGLYLTEGAYGLFTLGFMELEGTFTYGIDLLAATLKAGNVGTGFRAVHTPHFTGAFIRAWGGGNVALRACAFEGAATGSKYLVHNGGQISGHNANADLASLFGDTPGVVATPRALAGIRLD